MLTGISHKTVLLLGLVLLVMLTLACSSSPPDTADTAYDRGLKYSGQMDWKNAIEAYNVAIKLNPQYVKAGFDFNYSAYYKRGLAYYNLKEYKKAIQDYTEAIRLDPQDARAYNNRGRSHFALGEEELAERDFAKAKELEGE